jgi:transcriptional antiterminator RfaH
VHAPLFPGYVFINLDSDTARWRSINGTFGVHHLICQGDRPVPLADGIVEEIKRREDERGLVRLDPTPFAAGQRLRIADGAFYDTTGLFAEMADGERVVVLLNLLGRQVRVQVPLQAVTVDA